MSEKSEKKTAQTEQPKPIMFKCQFCGESKPLADLMIMRQYYPIISSCKECAKGPKTEAVQESLT
jgi:transcription elongation factor Elf1